MATQSYRVLTLCTAATRSDWRCSVTNESNPPERAVDTSCIMG